MKVQRRKFYLTLLSCLLFPLVCSVSAAWLKGLSMGLWVAVAASCVSAAIGWRVIQGWERRMRRSITHLLRERMEKLPSSSQSELQEIERLNGELELQQNLVEHKELLLVEYQRTIAEQRVIIEKKQQMIVVLEKRVRSLMHEIRGLLQLDTHTDESHIVDEPLMRPPLQMVSQTTPTPYDHSMQLQKYIEKAEAITGVDHLGYVGGKSPRFLDLSADCNAIDRRRLYDCFKEEAAAAVFIYAPADKKFLFVNPVVKSLTGWSPERFINEFPRCVMQGYLEWEAALSKVRPLKGSAARLLLEHREGYSKSFQCYMGMITKGPFARQILGIFTS